MQLHNIQNKIHEVRGYKVLLDFDLAELYEVENKRLKEAVRRNMNRFPADFIFELTREEYDCLRTQFATLNNQGRGKHSKFSPFAFTEQGVAMLSSVLNSPKSIEVNISIMRTFVWMRQYILSHTDLSEKIRELEVQYQQQFDDVFEAINYLISKEKQEAEQAERLSIGFKSAEREAI